MRDFTWTIEELATRYSLEPDLEDVFVEGAFDKDVLSAAFRKSHPGRTFYEIEVVDVPPETLALHGLTTGNKQRVIALARELAFLGAEGAFMCLVDRDLDHWFGPLEAIGKLRWTMFCSVELHYLTEDAIDHLLVVAGRAKISDVHAFFLSLVAVLRELYVLRLADRECGMSLRWVSLRKYLERDVASIAFAVDDYIVAVLSANDAGKRRREFERACAAWQKRLSGDPRLFARGHDYVALLAWAMRAFDGQREFSAEVAIERLFVIIAATVVSFGGELQSDD